MATMVDRVVIDASAAMAMIRREPQDSLIRRLLSNEDVEVCVPWIFWYELANSLIRRHRLGLDPVLEVIGTLDGMGIKTVDGDRPAVIAAAALAAAHGLSVYDASYLALAERMDARLLTLDVDLAAAAGDRAFAIGHELRETRTSHELRPWVRWSELDAYLDAVREATIASAR